ILLTPGTYTGAGNYDIHPSKKSLVFLGEGSADNTIIDCQADSLNPRRGFVLSGADSGIVIANVTVTNAYSDTGAGMYLDSVADALIMSCRLVGNETTGDGGGLFAYLTSGSVMYCEFADNRSGPGSGASGGGVSAVLCSLSVWNTVFRGNVADSGGALALSNDISRFDSCTFHADSATDGGAVCRAGGESPTHFANCTFYGNHATDSGSVLTLANNGRVQLENCLLAFNTGDYPVTWESGTCSSCAMDIWCTDIYGNEGGDYVGQLSAYLNTMNNINLDPLFCDTAGGDFSLAGPSPCASTNNACYATIGILDVGCNTGACGNIDGDLGGTITISDLLAFLNFLYNDSLPPDPLWVADLDRIAGISNNDLQTLVDHLFVSFAPLVCSPVADTTFPASADTLEVRGTGVAPMASTWISEVWIDASEPFSGIAFAFTCSCSTTTVTLDSIVPAEIAGSSFDGESIDSASGCGVIAFNAFSVDALSAGEHKLADLFFSVVPTGMGHVIQMDASSCMPNHTTVLSRLPGGPMGCPGVVPQFKISDLDYDGDGLLNFEDNCITVFNPLQEDVDTDFKGDSCDNCPNAWNPGQENSDADEYGDVCDDCTDYDGDGYGDPGFPGNTCPDDNCPQAYNSDQDDLDSDGIGDSCDVCTDSDGDGYGDPGFAANTCAIDNCVNTPNPDQLDTDGDGIGDVCDNCTDTDHDGYGNPGFAGNTCDEDNCPNLGNPLQQDLDGDGIGDRCDACTDTDGDGYGDPGFIANTCPVDNCPDVFNLAQEDFDGDGRGDDCDPGYVLFGSDLRCGTLPLTVQFNDTSVAQTSITDWYWEFGDGGSSYEQHPTHEYTSNGAFDVMLVISDGTSEDTLVKTDYIVLQDSVSANFQGLPTHGRSPLTVVFDPVLEGVATEYYWEFGDDSTSTERNPIHRYTQQGIYSVKLRVTLDLDGCIQEDSVIHEGYVVVNDLDARFIASPKSGSPGLAVQFTDSSTGDPIMWEWDFGDGYSSFDQDPLHVYDTAGLYDVKLTVDNGMFQDSLLKLGCIRIDSVFTDLYNEIYWTGVRPGFDFYYLLVWTNIGTHEAVACTLKVLLPPEMEFYDVLEGAINTGEYLGYDFVGDTLVIGLGDVIPTDWHGGYVSVWGRLPEWFAIGDSLTCESWLTTATSDLDLSNNYAMLRDEVVGSIDPNDKSATPAGRGDDKTIKPDQRLSYLIQFENKPEATAEAIYVRVVDTLDPDLDWGSLAMGQMSHPDACTWDFDPYTGVITWFCDSIMLPPNHNPPEGEGYFTYSVSPDKGLEQGTVISNTAWIRFDYNVWLEAPEDGPVVRTIYSGCCVGDVGNVVLDIGGNCGEAGDQMTDISDLTHMIDYLFISFTPLCCVQEADVDPLMFGGTPNDMVDVGDLTALIDHLFITFPALPACP
ncbi:MAG: PKD domain-containing protein, partial [candidate division Zixibacteria bacterium]|nr:PKD domain-containing protein [candidate division Zixibacteria bacterium]